MIFMEFKDVNVCDLLNDNDSSVGALSKMHKFVKEMLLGGRKLPLQCPVLENTKLAFDMINMDPNNFFFLPVVKFKLVILYAINNVPGALKMNITGQIVNAKKTTGI